VRSLAAVKTGEEELKVILRTLRSKQCCPKRTYHIDTHSSELAYSVRCSSEFMQEQRQGSVGRIGHSLSAAALLLHTSILMSDAGTNTSCGSCTVWHNPGSTVGPFCRSRIVAVVSFSDGSLLGGTHPAAKEDQERRSQLSRVQTTEGSLHLRLRKRYCLYHVHSSRFYMSEPGHVGRCSKRSSVAYRKQRQCFQAGDQHWAWRISE
jgi:hypothetical protein